MADTSDTPLAQWVRGLPVTAKLTSTAPDALRDRLAYVAELLREAGDRRGERSLLYRGSTGSAEAVPLVGELTVGRRAIPGLGDRETLSREHFRLQVGVDGVTLTDLGSRNGTLVNGARRERRVLLDGDVIEAGGQVFVFLDRLTVP